MTDDRPLVAGVAGWPITHSRSPRLFDHWFGRMGIPGRYVPLAIRADDFPSVVRALAKAGFRGINVTIPHKLAALALSDAASDAAKAIGAANILVFGEDGKITADNSDAYGFIENLRTAAPGWRPEAGSALVLGAGGAARAIVYGLLDTGVPRITLTNRTPDRAAELAAFFGDRVRVLPWGERSDALGESTLVVNTTSLGMKGAPALDMPLDHARDDATVTDIVYTPLETPLLADARGRGLVGVDGLGMLLHQARPAFRAWFGADPEVDDALAAAVLGGQA